MVLLLGKKTFHQYIEKPGPIMDFVTTGRRRLTFSLRPNAFIMRQCIKNSIACLSSILHGLSYWPICLPLLHEFDLT